MSEKEKALQWAIETLTERVNYWRNQCGEELYMAEKAEENVVVLERKIDDLRHDRDGLHGVIKYHQEYSQFMTERAAWYKNRADNFEQALRDVQELLGGMLSDG